MQEFKRIDLYEHEGEDLYIQEIRYQEGDIKIFIYDQPNNRELEIQFDAILMFRVRDEGDLSGEVARSTGLGGLANFFQVHNSELEALWRKDAARDPDELYHYAILTYGECVDILTVREISRGDLKLI